MTDEAKALVERVDMLADGNAWPSTVELLCDMRDLIETQAREIERLREALRFYADDYPFGNTARAALEGKP